MQQQSRGVRGVTADDVFMGNGVSELIDLVLRALLRRTMKCSCRARTIRCGPPP